IAGHYHPADHRSLGPPPFQRGGVPGRLRPRRHARRRGGGGLEAGHHRARLRAERPRALSLVAAPRDRDDPRGRGGAGRARGGRRRPPGRASGPAPADVAVRRRDAPGRTESEPRGRGGQGRRDLVRAGDPRDDPRPARRRAAPSVGQPVRADARLPHRERAVVLAARRDARGAARHHRARPRAAVAGRGRRSPRGRRRESRTGMNETQTILSDTVTRLLTDRVTTDLRETAEKGQWPAKLWQEVEEGGLTLPQIPEARGGGGGSWQDAYIVVSSAGRFAVPLPIAETMVGAWLLSECGLDVPLGPLTIAPARAGEQVGVERDGAGWRLTGTATRGPWGRAAEHGVVGAGDMIALVAKGGAEVQSDVNLALEPRDTLTWNGARVVAAAPAGRLPAGALRLGGALVRSAQIAGGLEYLLAQTVRYVSERKQFGRPIGGFQAIQHQCALLAGHTAAAGIAAANAFRAADRGDPAFEVAAAKVRTGEAAGLGAGIAHQCHGAIGFTYEHSLHFVTRRLWSWRPAICSAS